MSTESGSTVRYSRIVTIAAAAIFAVGALALGVRMLTADEDPLSDVKSPGGSRYSTPTPEIPGDSLGDPLAALEDLDPPAPVSAVVDAMLAGDTPALIALAERTTIDCVKGSERSAGSASMSISRTAPRSPLKRSAWAPQATSPSLPPKSASTR